MQAAAKVTEKAPSKPPLASAPMVKRDARGRILPGSVLNPVGGRPPKFRTLTDDNRHFVISEAMRILREGESNALYKDVLLKLVDKALPTVKATEVSMDSDSIPMGVIVLPPKATVVSNPHISEEDKPNCDRIVIDAEVDEADEADED